LEILAAAVDDSGKWLDMKEIPISVFRVRCSRLIWEVSKTKQPIRVTRFGKPVAEVHPPSPKRTADWIGSMKDSIEILGDVVSPASEEDDWEVCGIEAWFAGACRDCDAAETADVGGYSRVSRTSVPFAPAWLFR